MKTLVLAAVSLALWASVARPDATSGEMFGYRLGETAKNFDRAEVWFEMFGPPWLERVPENAAEEFDRLQVLVTPFSGTIIGLRMIADFDDIENADEFAKRMAAALAAKFGRSILFYAPPGSNTCPYDDTRYFCTISPADTDLYRARISNYVITLSRYEITDERPAVYLIFGVDDKNPSNKSVFDQLDREYQQYQEWSDKELLKREADRALRGIE